MIWLVLGSWCAWVLFMMIIHVGLKKDEPCSLTGRPKFQELDIVIAARNEGSNIEACLTSIDKQDWLPKRCRVIVIDDHSTDNTKDVVKSTVSQFSRLEVTLLNNQGMGKKAAISKGLEGVKAPVVLQVDGDCHLKEGAIESILSMLEADSLDACFGEVRLDTQSIFTNVLALENLNNQCVTEAFFDHGKPFMANGAIMAMRQNVVEDYRKSLNVGKSSGDDVFFIEALRKSKKSIGYCRNAIVNTAAPQSVSELFKQRVRWAGKTSAYNYIESKLIGMFVFVVQTTFVCALLLIPFIDGAIWILALWFLKWFIEYSFQRYWFAQRGVSLFAVWSFILSFSYPFYTSIIAVYSIIRPKVEWKGRVIK